MVVWAGMTGNGKFTQILTDLERRDRDTNEADCVLV